MLFNSFNFLWFLPLIVVAFYSVKHKHRWMLLLAASYYFYMCWRVEYVVLILFSTVLDYFAAIKMEEAPDKRIKKRWLWLSLSGNLGMLFTFKYFAFFAYNTEVFLSNFNVFYDSPALNILLPMGISFYTFQTLSYTIDVYKGKAKAERHLGFFALYVTYFPQLVAGPIERSTRLIPQLKEEQKVENEDFRYGIHKILLGFFKKVVVADNIGVFCDQMYSYPVHGSGMLYAITSFLFAVQLFADFSGYTDIAIGTARLMGVRLMENFNRPFWATSLSEFWSKWHISLTSWIGDYIFKPLLFGNPKFSNFYGVFIMVLVGFWHGASWNFIVFGLIHGVVILLQRYYKKIKLFQPFNKSKLGKYVFVTWNFALLAFTGLFFRNEFSSALKIIAHIFTDFRFNLGELRSAYQTEMLLGIFLSLLLLVTVTFNKTLQFRYNTLFVGAALLIIFLLGLDNQNQFIYFQF